MGSTIPWAVHKGKNELSVSSISLFFLTVGTMWSAASSSAAPISLPQGTIPQTASQNKPLPLSKLVLSQQGVGTGIPLVVKSDGVYLHLIFSL